MGEALKISDFDSIRLKLASPDDIRSWSHGEVTRPETINYRTQKPEKDGLFCEKIFGPSKDWECYCGKYKKIRYKGIVCDKCGVEVTRSVVRRQRMGHIDLASPVTHIWFLRGVPSKIGLVLDMSVQKLEKVIYFASFIVTEIDEEAKKEELDNLQKEYRSKMKNIEGQHKQKLNVLESADLKSKERKDELKKLESWHLNEEEDLKENFSSAEKELKDLKVLSIISESQFHDLSLRYGHVFEAGIGAEAIYKLLQRFDLEKTVLALESEIEHDEKGTKKKKIINRVKLLKSLFKNNLKPEWTVLNAVPVIPPDLRPMVPLDGGRFATSDLNDLYRRIISRNNRLKRLAELNAPEVICRNEKRMLQEAVDALIDNSARHTKTTTASTGQKRSLKSIADYLKGKQGRFRQNLLGKRIDYSGRSVIVVGPNLTLDQCGLPKKMALELFKPFVISRLIKEEYVHNIRSANRFIEADRPEVWDILEDIIKSALVMLNRAPTLHRLGIQAFRPILIEGKAIQLHPLVCSAFNADFDGDQMAVHVPLTEEAKQEARDLMLSTNNLLKPATGNPIATPSLDMVWGCYYVTLMREDQPKPIKTFADVEEAKLAYALRKISLRDKILIKVSNNKVLRGKVKQDMLETCLGRILFNELLPDKVDFFNEEVDKKRMGAIIKLCLEQYTFVEVAGVLDRVKNFGYKQLTKAGFSWGMKDTPEVKGKTELVDEGNGRVEVINEQFNNGLLTPDERYTKVIETWTDVKDRVTALTKDALDKNGPVYTMINSGSRGSWGQLTQMMGMKGLVTNPAGQIIELPVKANFREGFSVLEYYISSHGSRKGLTDTALRTAGAGYLTRRLVDVAQDVIVVKEDCGDTEGKIFTKEESEQMNQTLIERIVGRYLLSDIKDAKGKAIVKKGEVITDEIARKLDKLELDSANVRSVLSCKLPRGVCRKCYGFDLAYNREVKMGTAVGIIAAQSIGEPGTQLTMRTFHTGGVAGGDDITQGLPRVEEVFEARSPKKKALLSEVGGKVSIVEQPRTIKGPKGDIIARTSFGEKIIKVSYENKEDEVHKFKDISALKLKVKDGDLVKDNDVLYVDANKKKVKTGKSGTIRLSDKELVVSGTVQMEREYVIPAGTVLWVRDGVEIEKGDQLTEGSLALEQLYKLKGRQAVEKYILKEIQYIYKSQGQPLNDKHVETIVKQMFSRVYVEDPGDTNLLEGEIVEYSELIEENQKTAKEKGRLAEYREVFLGISKVSLSTKSFLAAASFQETARVLINAAVTGKIDRLEGLKENIIIGRLIPAGTGFGATVEDLARGTAHIPTEKEKSNMEDMARATETEIK